LFGTTEQTKWTQTQSGTEKMKTTLYKYNT